MKKWKAMSGVILALWATPALAGDVRYDGPDACGFWGFDSCGYGQVRERNQIVDACDTRKDGRGYYVRYELYSGETGTVRDGNGAAANCGIERVGSYLNPVVGFTVCVEAANYTRDICSPWKYNW